MQMRRSSSKPSSPKKLRLGSSMVACMPHAICNTIRLQFLCIVHYALYFTYHLLSVTCVCVCMRMHVYKYIYIHTHTWSDSSSSFTGRGSAVCRRDAA